MGYHPTSVVASSDTDIFENTSHVADSAAFVCAYATFHKIKNEDIFNRAFEAQDKKNADIIRQTLSFEDISNRLSWVLDGL